MTNIIAIGGGEISQKETLSIDRDIAELTQKSRPKALFIATASGEPQPYIGSFSSIYANILRCRVGTLRLITAQLSDAELAEKILGADLIYVGGGNTKRMMEIWQSRGIGSLLYSAWRQGTVLSGLSAGSICWFAAGHSDSEHAETGKYISVDGLGFLPWFHIPHYNERSECEAYLIENQIPQTVALENNAALHIQDNQFRILKSNPAAAAYAIRIDKSVLTKKPLTNPDFRPVSELFNF